MLWGLPRTKKEEAPEINLNGERKLISSCFMITSPEFCLFNTGVTLTGVLARYELLDLPVEWLFLSSYYCPYKPHILPLFSFGEIAADVDIIHMPKWCLKRLTYSSCFQGDIFTVKGTSILWVTYKVSPSHHSAATSFSIICIIYVEFTGLYYNFDHIYVFCLYHM